MGAKIYGEVSKWGRAHALPVADKARTRSGSGQISIAKRKRNLVTATGHNGDRYDLMKFNVCLKFYFEFFIYGEVSKWS